MAVKELQPGHMKIRAAHDFWDNLRANILRKGVHDVKLNPKGKFTEVDLRMWAAKNGYAIIKLPTGAFRIALRKAA